MMSLESSRLLPHLGWIRAQFPALSKMVHGRPAVFMDAPGGTQVPQRVMDAMTDYLIHANANTHGAFVTSRRTDDMYRAAHAGIADLLGCDADEVVFGGNMTTLTFAMSRAIGREIRDGDEIVVTCLDHDANVAPWLALEEKGAVVRTVDIDVKGCTLDMHDMQRTLTSRTRIVAVGWASNAVGTITDVREVVRLAHAVGALVYVDAVHYVPHQPVDVRDLDCDFLACSPYKFFGPHTGAVYGKRAHLMRLKPYKVRPCSEAIPDRWESGTQNHEGMAGVAAGIEYLAELGRRVSRDALRRRMAVTVAMEAIREYEATLSRRLIEGLLKIPRVTIYGLTDLGRVAERTPTVSIRMSGYPPLDLAEDLGERGIFVWSGNFYAQNLTQRLGVESDGGLLRIGLAHYNTMEEIEQLLDLLQALPLRP